MNADRIKEIQQETAYPESVSVQQALLKVWNEQEQLRLHNVSQRSELFFAFLKWAKQADLDYPDEILQKDFEHFTAKNCG
ncbi:hypothetical protein [Seonamhaeicola sp.]|uniref:hypothetical protein n=1 Tax=Seonamhaeicola sp. TaxID=1912245 RepID=UPI0035691408